MGFSRETRDAFAPNRSRRDAARSLRRIERPTTSRSGGVSVRTGILSEVFAPAAKPIADSHRRCALISLFQGRTRRR